MQTHKFRGLSRDLPLGLVTVNKPKAVSDQVRSVWENRRTIRDQLIRKNNELIEKKGLALSVYLSDRSQACSAVMETLLV